MSKRGIPRPAIPTKTTNPARTRVSSEQQQREKRQKTSSEVPPPSSSLPTEPEDSRAPIEKGVTAEPQIDLTDPPTEYVSRREFSPSYTMPDGRVLLLNDSVKEEPNLAVTLLRGLALPRDFDQVPIDLLLGLGEMCSHLVQVCLLSWLL